MVFRNVEKNSILPTREQALPGRATPITTSIKHVVLGTHITDSLGSNFQGAMFGMGCFWGVERLFWLQEGVYCTAVGYSAGYTPNPTYEEVCSGLTVHNEVVTVVFDTEKIAYQTLLEHFWENHNPCSAMQQGNDSGSQYRSGIYTMNSSQHELALESKAHYQSRLTKLQGDITTEVLPATDFYLAEQYHQQYLAKNPNGYCNAQTIERTGLPRYK